MHAVPMDASRGHQITTAGLNRLLVAAMWVLGPEPKSSKRVISALNHRVTSPPLGSKTGKIPRICMWDTPKCYILNDSIYTMVWKLKKKKIEKKNALEDYEGWGGRVGGVWLESSIRGFVLGCKYPLSWLHWRPHAGCRSISRGAWVDTAGCAYVHASVCECISVRHGR